MLKSSTWTGGDLWRLNTSIWAEGGSQQSTFSGVSKWFEDDELTRHRHLEVNELFLTLNQNNFDLTVGKKLFPTGICTLVSPSDRLRPVYAYDPIDPKEVGLWQTRFDYYLDRVTLTGAVLPVYMTPKVPHQSSRWMGDLGNKTVRDYNFQNVDASDADATFENEYPKIQWTNIGYFGKAKTTYAGYDLFLSVYAGLNPYYVLKRGG